MSKKKTDSGKNASRANHALDFASEFTHGMCARLIDTSFDLVWQSDFNGKFIRLNENWLTVFGYPLEKMIGESLVRFQADNEAQRWHSVIADLQKGNSVRGFATKCKGNNGTTIHLLINASPVADDNGTISGFIGTARDLTPYKKIEQSQREGEERYRAVVETTDTGYVALDGNGNVINANENYLRLTGRPSLDDIIGRSVIEWTAPYDRKRNAVAVAQCFESGCIRNLVIDYIHPDGTIVPIELNATIIKTKSGTIIETLCRDITERKEAEQSLRRKTTELDTYFSTSLDLFCIADTDGVFRRLNPEWEHTLGYTLDELIGKRFIDFVHPEDRDATLTVISKLSKQEEVRNFINRYRCKDGTYRWIEWRCVPIGNIIYSAARDITRRKQIEETLLESYRFTENLIQTANVIIVGLDLKGNIKIFNRYAQELTGYTAEELSGRNWFDVLVPSDRFPQVRKEFDRLAFGGFPTHFENPILTRTGDERHIVWSNNHVYESGRISGTISFGLDITDGKIAAEALRQSEERFRRIFEEGEFGITLAGTDFRFIGANPAFCRMIGYSEQELCELTFSDITSGERVAHDMHNVNAIRTGSLDCYKTEKKYIRKNGDILWGSLMTSAIRDDKGNILYYLAMVEDITERKSAEIALAAEKERLAVTLRSIGDGVITTDISGTITSLNKAAEFLTGWPQEEACGQSLPAVFKILDDTSTHESPNPIARVLAKGEIVELAEHTYLIARDGSERLIADSGAPIRDNEGNTIGVVLVFRDITEKMRLIETSQNAQRIESLGVLAGGIAHDFNNLLGGIYGNIGLARTLVADNEAAEYLDMTLATLNRARGLTQQLLTFSKGGTPVRKPGNLFPLVREASQFALSGTRVTCTYKIAHDLWPCDFDAAQIGQVIDNLVLNAVQAMPLGGNIELSAENIELPQDDRSTIKKGKFVRISIKDSGVGIPRKIIPRIFDPFFTTKQTGSGLGLATTYSIINRHGGSIDVSSEPGKGAIFRVLIPASTHAVSSSAVEASETRSGTGRILVMDDESILRQTLGVMIKSLGYDVDCVENGEGVIRRIREARKNGAPYSAILLDLTIHGGMGGHETIDEIRRIDTAIPVIVSSGYTDDPIMADPKAFGFNDSLSKPFTMTELSKVLERATRK